MGRRTILDCDTKEEERDFDAECDAREAAGLGLVLRRGEYFSCLEWFAEVFPDATIFSRIKPVDGRLMMNVFVENGRQMIELKMRFG